MTMLTFCPIEYKAMVSAVKYAITTQIIAGLDLFSKAAHSLLGFESDS